MAKMFDFNLTGKERLKQDMDISRLFNTIFPSSEDMRLNKVNPLRRYIARKFRIAEDNIRIYDMESIANQAFDSSIRTYDDEKPHAGAVAPVKQNNNFCFVDVYGKLALQPDVELSSLSQFSEGYCVAQKSDDGKFFYFTRSGKHAFNKATFNNALSFSEHFAAVEGEFFNKNTKMQKGFYFITRNGDHAFKNAFFHDARSFSGSLAPVKKDGRWGFIDCKGELQIDYQFHDALGFLEGFAVVKNNQKAYFITREGKHAFNGAVFEDARNFSGGLAAVKKNGMWGFIDNKGKQSLDCKYTSVRDFIDDIAAVQTEAAKWVFIETKIEKQNKLEETKSKNKSYIDEEAIRSYRIINDNSFDETLDFSEDVAAVKINGYFKYINKSGKPINDKTFTSAGYFKSGLAPVSIDGKNFTYKKKDGTEAFDGEFTVAGLFPDRVTLENYIKYIINKTLKFNFYAKRKVKVVNGMDLFSLILNIIDPEKNEEINRSPQAMREYLKNQSHYEKTLTDKHKERIDIFINEWFGCDEYSIDASIGDDGISIVNNLADSRANNPEDEFISNETNLIFDKMIVEACYDCSAEEKRQTAKLRFVNGLKFKYIALIFLIHENKSSVILSTEEELLINEILSPETNLFKYEFEERLNKNMQILNNLLNKLNITDANIQSMKNTLRSRISSSRTSIKKELFLIIINKYGLIDTVINSLSDDDDKAIASQWLNNKLTCRKIAKNFENDKKKQVQKENEIMLRLHGSFPDNHPLHKKKWYKIDNAIDDISTSLGLDKKFVEKRLTHDITEREKNNDLASRIQKLLKKKGIYSNSHPLLLKRWMSIESAINEISSELGIPRIDVEKELTWIKITDILESNSIIAQMMRISMPMIVKQYKN